ncbi:hypothetical protein [Nocardiopsis sp. JB363]|uniref:hypothetical protein n=1 Tax=Nocardiopsis sp. JB363 TaxID=1434837 RepID=UPI00135B46AA|nr:hypothetical protein [Nocardiopsis sp. JB363]
MARTTAMATSGHPEFPRSRAWQPAEFDHDGRHKRLTSKNARSAHLLTSYKRSEPPLHPDMGKQEEHEGQNHPRQEDSHHAEKTTDHHRNNLQKHRKTAA